MNPSSLVLSSLRWKLLRWGALHLVGCLGASTVWGQTNNQAVAVQSPADQAPANQVRYAKLNKTEVRCGPGEDYYVTSHLKVGAAVEVFRNTKDGWSAIRPPEGSFCWLAAENAYLLPGGQLAEVVGNKVPAWIGSTIGTPKQFLWRIELQPSQQVQVLGEAKQRIEDKERLWYRIAPPQGEFRWVRTDALSVRAPIADPNDPPIESSVAASSKEERPSTAKESGVQRAQYLEPAAPKSRPTPRSRLVMNQDSTPQNSTPQSSTPQKLNEGEYIVGSEEVVADRIVGESRSGSSMPMPIPMQSGNPQFTIDEGVVEEGGDGEYIEGETIVEDEATPRGSRFPIQFIPGGDSSFKDWNALDSHPGRVLVRPLNGILGLIGFGIAESEIIEPSHSSRHIVSNVVPGGEAVITNRFDSLPRPTRRLRGHSFRSLLQPSDSDLGSQPEPMPRYLSASTPTVPSTTTDAWHAHHRSQGANEATSHSFSSPGTGPSWVSQANSSLGPPRINPNDLEPMQLSTPQLQDAFFELTRIVALPTDQWDFRQVHQYASDWVERGATAMERGEARLLAERIQQFESLRMRMNGNSVAGLASSSASMMPNDRSNARGGIAQAGYTSPMDSNSSVETASWSSAPQSDASGILTQVFTSRPGQPEFALTDSSKSVVAYVIPSPGMNLRRYLDQPVAIYGTRGFLPELNAKQILAERVVRLR